MTKNPRGKYLDMKQREREIGANGQIERITPLIAS
jgi:hypothetical protein